MPLSGRISAEVIVVIAELCLVHLALGCFLLPSSSVGTLGLARRAEPKIFLRGLVIGV